MKKTLFWFFFIFLSLISLNLKAEIIECSQLADLASMINKDDHIFLEIDNVLLRAQEEVATTDFFEYLRHKSLLQGHTADQITNQLYPLWVKVQKLATTRLAEANLDLFLNQLSQENVCLSILSNRGPCLVYRSLDQLHENNLQIGNLDFHYENFEIDQDSAVVYKNMIMLHPLCNKGSFLKSYFNKKGIKPKKVICVDYQLVQLVNIQQAMDELNVPFLGIYLRGASPFISDYTKQVGEIQLQYIDKILGDNEAELILGECVENY